MPTRRTALSVALVAALVVALGLVGLTHRAAPRAAAAGLVPYTGCDQLLAHHRAQLRASMTPWGSGDGPFLALESGAGDAVTAAGPVPAAGRAADDAVGRGATGTNLQEQDVDEPDRAKLRDGHLVVLAQQRLNVLTATATPTVVSSYPWGADPGEAELLLVGDRALVVTHGWEPARGSTLPGQETTTLRLFDLSRPEAPQLLEQAAYDGRYLSARLVDGSVRLVTSTTPQVPLTYPRSPGRAAEQAALAANQRAAAALPLDAVLPQVVRRSGTGRVLAQGPAVGCEQVSHAGDSTGSSTLLVSTLRPEDGLEATDATAVTAYGDVVYASSERLYVATSRWGTTGPVPVADLPASRVAGDDEQVTTQLHAFDTTSPTRTRYLGSGSVDGYLLGRWALSEHEGALRVATTRQPPWESGEETSSSVVVLVERDGGLVETGRVDGLGKDERIQAVRYLGDLAAVVTFRQTDPLYLVDLSDVTAPRVLGELKVPGFSTYLHPLGDGLLLGVGHDATDTGQVTGMQLSVFDVRDLSRPTQVDRLSLGPAHSPALDDSRAFGYDPQRRLATLPFSTYGEGSRSAALGVHVSTDGTLREVGRMPVHGSPAERVLSDGERVYAVSGTGVVAGEAATLRRTGAVTVG